MLLNSTSCATGIQSHHDNGFARKVWKEQIANRFSLNKKHQVAFKLF